MKKPYDLDECFFGNHFELIDKRYSDRFEAIRRHDCRRM